MRPQPLPAIAARRLTLAGRVQGVGFRPFVYRLAHRFGLTGWVKNATGRVEIHAEGPEAALHAFEQALITEAPALSQPRVLASAPAAAQAHTRFEVAPSSAGKADIHVPPDFFACDDCVRELNDPKDRRHRYPFINCTQCGPRYTLIEHLPYDRPNTTMAGFTLCPECQREYENPLDRRFHAEPVACPVCGPQLSYREAQAEIHDTPKAQAACVAALRAGKIVAVKGIGGYHLMCDARSDSAVARLRAKKPRPHKPLAVMFPWRGADGLDAVREVATPNDEQARLLRDPMRPIVLVPVRASNELSDQIAPGLKEVGCFLPYSPLHHLILDDFGGPLVATSGNISGEPVLTDNAEADARLGHVAEAFLHHDRPIARPADDPVYRVIAGTARPLRLGRGVAPLELVLPFKLAKPLLAVGGHMKNTVALAWGNRAVISPHIGDLDAPRSLSVFEQVIADLQQLYGVTARRVVCDVHPGYASTRFAKKLGLPLVSVLHHHAHASALAGEYPEIENWLVFTWDGVGFGEDGTLWGGEALFGKPGGWKRVASFRPFRLPGGEKAGREPWRSAAALCWEAGMEWRDCPENTTILRQAWDKRLNAPQTSAVGRLFDAAAAFTGLNYKSSFEGQGPMLLEASVNGEAEPVVLPLATDNNGVLRADWAPLLPALMDTNRTPSARAAMFQASLAQSLVEQARTLRETHGEFTVGLSGGVFQNRVLTERALALLAAAGFDTRLGQRIPCNDAGISYGQIIETASR
ncbi:MAG: carbamoyltransferase HypF [Gammaproteobacteria bacterium]|nr:MAG: carbamoyltransferase HypF [Gammaproteobacteria bacterium]